LSKVGSAAAQRVGVGSDLSVAGVGEGVGVDSDGALRVVVTRHFEMAFDGNVRWRALRIAISHAVRLDPDGAGVQPCSGAAARGATTPQPRLRWSERRAALDG
jgi:hypothetical protein